MPSYFFSAYRYRQLARKESVIETGGSEDETLEKAAVAIVL